ncbi:hypothetical protein HYT24_01930 [Candidatus Pacearchaeota archaeon]|nr:hypothetical protein [Candidatus Pacearchaeota archaeon]
MQKKGLLLLVFLLITFVYIGFALALVTGSCTVQTKSSCQSQGKYVVGGLSSNTNAHGELPSQNNYNYALCCDFSGTATCSGSNEIYSLSSATNAHAQIPSQTSYTNQICYRDLSCVSTSSSCDSNYPIQMLSLSAYTNAHLSQYGSYSINICCTSPTLVFPPAKSFWSNDGVNTISQISIIPDVTKVKLVFEDKSLSNGTGISFVIYEDDALADDNIRSLSASISSGKAVAEWTIRQQDLDKTPNDYTQFYFIANGTTSNFLSLNITSSSSLNLSNIFTCSDYTTQSYCESDPAEVAEASIPDTIDCSDPSIACFCSWDSATGKCSSAFGELDGNGSLYGTCRVAETQNDPNGCNDGFLTISWTGSWSWSNTNPTHQDPKGLEAKCNAGGTKTLECPAQVQLPFFTMTNIIAAILIIAGIYLILSMKHKPKRKKRSRKKRS